MLFRSVAQFQDRSTLTPEEAHRQGYREIGEVAAKIGVSRSNLRNLAKARGLPTVRVRTGQCGTRAIWIKAK